MILAAHLTFSAYGFWLPNAQSGSWSDFVRSWELFRFGPAKKTEERRSAANQAFDPAIRAAAKKSLRYPPVVFNGLQACAIALGFWDVMQRTGCRLYACAIMPDHVHLVVGRHQYPIQQLANLLKGGATTRLRRHGLDPFAAHLSRGPKGRAPSPWAHRYWKVWLDSHADVARAIEYANNNPIRAGYKRQDWKFLTPYGA